VPGADGRAGMALVVPQAGARFDPKAYFEFSARVLPPYARPLFVRVAGEMDLTGTLKHTKLRLQEEGFDPLRVRDPLWFRDDSAATYRPLDTSLKASIDAGEIKF
jgi:fatty-acyl-CoA synthase